MRNPFSKKKEVALPNECKPVTKVDNSEFFEHLLEAFSTVVYIGKLNKGERLKIVFLLRLYNPEKYSCEAIAELCNVPVETIYRDLSPGQLRKL